MTERVRVFDWFSYSHWGSFRLALFTCPYWFPVHVDDDLIEDAQNRDHGECALKQEDK